MRSPFFPPYKEEGLLERQYSIMARLHCYLDFETTVARDFFWIADMVAKDVADENKKRQMDAAMARSRMRKHRD